MTLINQYAKGYLYFVTLKGVVGADSFDMDCVKADYLKRKSQTILPLMVGFGIKTPEMAADVSRFSDAVIVGAALINQMVSACENDPSNPGSGLALIGQMRRAIDNNGH